MENKQEQIEIVKLLEDAKMYDEMVVIMKRIVELDENLTSEEYQLLQTAYKNIISGYQSSWQSISKNKKKATNSEFKRKMITEFCEKIECRLKDCCYELLNLLDKYLVPKAIETEIKVKYMKMKGDLYRYVAEITSDDERQKMIEESQSVYTDAFNMAKNELPVTHPVRLNVALNFSVFLYEILEKRAEACQMSHQAFRDGIAEIDSLDVDHYKDTTFILQLLQDNLSLWITDESNFDHENESEEQK